MVGIISNLECPIAKGTKHDFQKEKKNHTHQRGKWNMRDQHPLQK